VEDGEVTRTHLVCPYPQSAQFIGDDPNDAASFVCR